MEKTESKTYDKELSFGNYIGKKIYETVVSLTSLAAGTWAGLTIAGKAIKPAVELTAENSITLPSFLGKLPGLKGRFTGSQLQWGGIGGAVAGSLVGGIILGYEHWKKVKREQLQVDEITRDVSDIEVFRKTDPELAAENKRLWAELNARKGPEAGGSHAEIHAKKQEHAEWGDRIKDEKAHGQKHEVA